MEITILETINVGGIEYSIVPAESCVDIGRHLHNSQCNWHIHVLSPGCQYNPYGDLFCMVVEDNTHGVAYLGKSAAFPEADKVLVKLLHGDDILDASCDCHESSEADSSAVAVVQQLHNHHHAWHHHMHFPDCLLNPQPGQWAISVESASTRLCEVYEAEPVSQLSVIESLYFSAPEHQ
ncbi:hypothetical protein [Tatumella citrea]|uniref:Uncharacterized protein n=1 Tax=Tatumella citrea TaxID=53336 RepID=A0A1Y0L6Z4_TATCI|nr:hypothetical protein [Tatumella citrea]ARU93801.1 hypothetical protein A7K98_08440 [Tatumella citrea]ARU97839.1 hypothetical protein A7K99_08440 [Tatumella citrea]